MRAAGLFYIYGILAERLRGREYGTYALEGGGTEASPGKPRFITDGAAVYRVDAAGDTERRRASRAYPYGEDFAMHSADADTPQSAVSAAARAAYGSAEAVFGSGRVFADVPTRISQRGGRGTDADYGGPSVMNGPYGGFIAGRRGFGADGYIGDEFKKHGSFASEGNNGLREIRRDETHTALIGTDISSGGENERELESAVLRVLRGNLRLELLRLMEEETFEEGDGAYDY